MESLERRATLQALWDCQDPRCSLCATCLMHLREALGMRWPDHWGDVINAPPIAEDDPVRFVPQSTAPPVPAPPKLRHWRRKTRPK